MGRVGVSMGKRIITPGFHSRIRAQYLIVAAVIGSVGEQLDKAFH